MASTNHKLPHYMIQTDRPEGMCSHACMSVWNTLDSCTTVLLTIPPHAFVGTEGFMVMERYKRNVDCAW